MSRDPTGTREPGSRVIPVRHQSLSLAIVAVLLLACGYAIVRAKRSGASVGQATEPASLHLGIATAKPAYLLDEVVVFTLSLRNEDDTAWETTKLAPASVEKFVDGRSMRRRPKGASMVGPDLLARVSLSPGKTLTWITALRADPETGLTSIRPGTHRLSARYTPGKRAKSPPAWVLPVEAPAVEFVVRAPRGSERTAHRLLTGAVAPDTPSARRRTLLAELLAKFPESAYVPGAVDGCAAALRLSRDLEGTLDVVKKYEALGRRDHPYFNRIAWHASEAALGLGRYEEAERWAAKFDSEFVDRMRSRIAKAKQAEKGNGAARTVKPDSTHR